MVTSAAENRHEQIEINVIPEDWDIVLIGDHFDFKNGLNKEKKYFGFGTPIVNYMDVYTHPGIKLTDLIGKVSVSKGELLAYEVRKGDVFFTRTSETVDEIGFSSVILEDVKNTVFSGFLLRARPKTDSFDLQFKKYCFRSAAVRKQIKSMSCETTRALTNGKLLSRVTVLVPKNKEEQSIIAQVLSDIDVLIDSLDRLIVKKKNVKQGTMQELLTGKNRLPGFKGEFLVKRLDDLSIIYRGASPRPIDDPKWFDKDSNIGWVRISDVTKSNKYLFDTTQCLSEKGVKSSRLVSSNNLIMSICATVGRPIITRKTVCIHDGFVVFEKPLANIEYLYYYLSSIEKKWSRHGQTGSQMNLNTTIIGNEKVPLPSTLEEQSAIAEILSSMDLEIEGLECKRDKYKLLKVGSMQQLLTGRIRLKCQS